MPQREDMIKYQTEPMKRVLIHIREERTVKRMAEMKVLKDKFIYDTF